MDKRKLLEAKRKWIMFAKDLEQIQIANNKRLEDENPVAWPYEHVEKVKTQVYDAYQEYLRLVNENKENKESPSGKEAFIGYKNSRNDFHFIGVPYTE